MKWDLALLAERSARMSTICEMLGCRYPIIQGAMGMISNPELVAAVSNAGGFGLLASGFIQDPEVLRLQIKATRMLTDQPFGANLQVMNPMSRRFADILVEEGLQAATVSGGSPKVLVPFLKTQGITAIVVVPSVDLACKAEALGVDAIIAEGTESGGVQGLKGASTLVLVPAVVDAVHIPVVAAGGIADARGYKAAMALGAKGVQVGTRFIASTECIAHATYKDSIVRSTETDALLMELGTFRIRALCTGCFQKTVSDDEAACKALSLSALHAAWLQGDSDAGILPAGQAAGLIRQIKPVQEIIAEIVGIGSEKF